MELYPFQLEANREVWRRFCDGAQSVVLQIPTGGGKTLCAAHLAAMWLEHKRERTIFLAHRRELVMQPQEKLEHYGLRPDIIMAGEIRNPHANVHVASIQTLLSRRREPLPEAGLVVVDECHLGLAKGFRSVIEEYMRRGTRILGLTATPMRQDGLGLRSIFQEMVSAPSVPWMMEHGFLVPRIRYRVGLVPDVTQVDKSGGEYNRTQLQAASDRGDLLGDIMENWLKFSEGRRTLCFTTGIQHSLHVVERFKAAGVSAAHIDGDTPKEERDAIYQKSESGEVMVVSNAQVYIEGTDMPWIETLIDAQKNLGIVRYLQKGGRLMRAAVGKDYGLYLDHAGNIERHGVLELDRHWELTADKGQAEKLEAQRKKGERVQVFCPQCGFLMRSRICEQCRFEFQRKGEARDTVQMDLMEMTWEQKEVKERRAKKPELTTEQKQAWYGGLLWIARKNGKSDGLAWHSFKQKFGHFPAGYPKVPVEPSFEVQNWDKHRRIAWAKGRRRIGRASVSSEVLP